MELAAFPVEADILAGVFIAVRPVVETLLGPRVLRGELEARRENLLHEQARGDRLERVVDGGTASFGRIRLRDQIGKPGSSPSRRVAGGAANNLNDLGKTAAIADRERVFAPNPVEALLCHAERNDDVHMIAVVALRRVFQRRQNLDLVAGSLSSTRSATLIDATFWQLDHVEAGHGIDALPFAEGVHDLLDFLVLVLGALAGS